MNRLFLNALFVILGFTLWTTASAANCRNRATGRVVVRAACVPNQEEQVPPQPLPVLVTPPTYSPPLAMPTQPPPISAPAYPTTPSSSPPMNNICSTQLGWCPMPGLVPSGFGCQCPLNDGSGIFVPGVVPLP